VEDWAAALWPDHAHAAIALPDLFEVARIALLSTRPGATRADLAAWFRSRDLPEYAAPGIVLFCPSLPRLGNGAIDYAAVTAIARRPRIAEVA
jgi:acyl-[acyl-carrier-protein]-phospholipid O-acyltransferase/long-chain-fatty-acid--[acyl-carrier-protein] ligase